MIYTTVLVTGGLFALVVSTLSIYLADELHVRPLLIGSFFLCLALTSIFYSQIIAFWSDRIGDKRKIIFLSLSCGAVACLGFSVLLSFSGALLTAISFLSVSYTALAHVLSEAKNYANEQIPQKEIERFHTTVNSCFVFSLLLGPALGFGLLTQISYSQLYMSVGGIYALFAALSLMLLPRAPSTTLLEYDSLPRHQQHLMLAGICAFVLLFAAHQGYVIGLPLFIQQEFGWGHGHVSLLYAVSVIVQGGVIFRSAWRQRQSLSTICGLAAIAGALLNLLVWQAQSFWLLVAAQLLLAIYVGWGIGLGMRWLCATLPSNDMSAPIIYFNTMSFGCVLGSVGFAFFTEFYGFSAIFVVNVGLCCLAIPVFAVIRFWESSREI